MLKFIRSRSLVSSCTFLKNYLTSLQQDIFLECVVKFYCLQMEQVTVKKRIVFLSIRS